MIREVLSWVAMGGGALFFAAGTLGLLRFPEVYTRLHSLAKADNVGLGLLCVGLAVRSGSPWVAAKLLLIWALALLASTTSAQLLASQAYAADREGAS